MTPVFFESADELRRWFRRNHRTATDLWVGYYKRATGKPSVTWSQSVDEALCVGWIDGIRKRIDGERYTIRFTPRRPGSVWSAININRVRYLAEHGRMLPEGHKAFEARRERRSRIYSYEQQRGELEPRLQKILEADKKAWAFFQTLPPSYRKVASWAISSAKQEATKQRRLRKLVDACREKRRLF
jgi:uncharacterized protein YdeI (YjbR/CyaY-like superfamily)